jgi:hypothetical protein
MVDNSATISTKSTEGNIIRAVNLERVILNAANYAEFYANDTQVQTSVFDVRLTFGVIADVSVKDNRAVIHRVADVRMSLHHAKMVAAILTEQIHKYEAQVGTLTLPAEP